MNDSIELESLRAILPESSFNNLQHLALMKSKIETLTRSYKATVIASGEQMRRDLVEEDEMIKVYLFLKYNDFLYRSLLLESAGYSSNELAYYARSETQQHPRKGINCVYLLLKDNQVIYIGRSANLKSRLNQHRRDKDFDNSEFHRCDSLNQAKDLEAILIQQHRPILNQRIEKRTGL